MRLYGHIGIPLDISNLRIACEQVIDNTEDKILHLRIGEVEHELCSSSSHGQRTVRGIENPIRMLVIELTGFIGHFRLYPNTKLHLFLFGCTYQSFNAIRQLTFIHNPIAQRRIIHITAILAAKPSVVHNKKLTTHVSDILHHLCHLGLFDVEINSFPTVEKHIAQLIAMAQFVFTSPTMEGATHTTLAFLAIGKCQRRGNETFAFT